MGAGVWLRGLTTPYSRPGGRSKTIRAAMDGVRFRLKLWVDVAFWPAVISRGGEESLLVGFTPTGIVIDSGPLPHGRGFRVESVKEEMPGDVRTWVALTRQPDGSAVIFARMADDVLVMLRSHDGSNAELFRLFTGRIRAWQAFMERGWDEMLGATAEVGLVGELSFLRQLLDAGWPSRSHLTAGVDHSTDCTISRSVPVRWK